MPLSDAWTSSSTSNSTCLVDDREMFAFDVDDPDFHHDPVLEDHLNLQSPSDELNEVFQLVYHQGMPGLRKVKTSPMALSSLQNYTNLDLRQCELYSPNHKSHSVESLDQDPEPSMYDYSEINIEELRLQMNSCFTCGVSWQEDHVSLDCQECGGYSMERPCPVCDGKCGSSWKRDLATSHSLSKANWMGTCERHSDSSNSTEMHGSDLLSHRFQSLHAS